MPLTWIYSADRQVFSLFQDKLVYLQPTNIARTGEADLPSAA
jgi:hypothetical protein